MKFITTEKDVQLVMWDKTMMSDSKAEKDPTGKTVFVKTGSKSEYTTYTLRDGFGDKIILTSKDNSFRTLEGKKVDLFLEVKRDEFKNINKVSLVGMTEVKK